MKPSSAKQKGRILQQKVAKAIQETFNLHPRDARSTPMGLNGADVMLSKAAADVFPFAVECKNKEQWKAIFNAFAQAESHVDEDLRTPLLVIGKNYSPPLAIVSLEVFMDLVKNYNGDKL